MSTPSQPRVDGPRKAVLPTRGPRGWSERCAELFEDLRRPARAMISRAYGKALTDEEIEDVYAAAWAATLSALRTRGEAMNDQELRAYVLTAVASHASKELRRRARKPTGSFDGAREHFVTDSHEPLPEERAIGSESRGIARDLLTSLPARRRAVMLLRYGWGLSPSEVCALVGGLSSRAYRKEVTRGVEQLIERLKQVESGEWCESREPLLRDYLAGTADEEVERQVRQHLEHCRACSDFAARLTGHLHELGGVVALSTISGSIGQGKLPLFDRLSGVLHGPRDGVGAMVERGETTIGSVAASGGARGSGAVGAGVVAKLAGLGSAGKAVVACLGAGVAASACVAVGVVPGVSLKDAGPEAHRDKRITKVRHRAKTPPTPAPGPGLSDVVAVEIPVVAPGGAPETPSEDEPKAPDVPSEASKPAKSASSPPPAPTPVEQECDPTAPAAEASSPAPVASPSPSPPSSSSPSPSGKSPSSVASSEFGP